MDVKNSLDHVSRLIETYPDVRVRNVEISGDFAVIEFHTPALSSLSRISYAAGASNENVIVVPPYSFHYGYPYSENSGYGKEMNSSELNYRIRIKHVMEGCPPSELQILGIFMARDLEALGLVSEEKLDFLMKSWLGFRKPADRRHRAN